MYDGRLWSLVSAVNKDAATSTSTHLHVKSDVIEIGVQNHDWAKEGMRLSNSKVDNDYDHKLANGSLSSFFAGAGWALTNPPIPPPPPPFVPFDEAHGSDPQTFGFEVEV